MFSVVLDLLDALVCHRGRYKQWGKEARGETATRLSLSFGHRVGPRYLFRYLQRLDSNIYVQNKETRRGHALRVA